MIRSRAFVFGVALPFAMIGLGCSSSSTGSGLPEDDSGIVEHDGATSGNDSGGGGMDSSMSNPDTSTPVDASMPGNDATPGTAMFGDLCTQNSDCASNMCEPFVMMTIHRCTKPCTANTAAMDCPSPPSAGTCTNNGYCRFTM
jgi:hypothetical protein